MSMTLQSSQAPVEDRPMSSSRENRSHGMTSKQRKLRKGTRSCWECKRRKARCVFSEGDNTTCVGCSRRGNKCVDQSENDVEPDTKEGATNRRLDRIEAMLKALVERQTRSSPQSVASSHENSLVPWENLQMGRTVHEKMSSQTTNSRPSKKRKLPSTSSARTSIHQGLSNTLSETLYNLLPSPEECRQICSSTKFLPCFFQQMLTRNWKVISASQDLPVLTANRVARLPAPDVHPILLAQKMLMLACLAQSLSREREDDNWNARAAYMASKAIDVVAKEEICHNAEGLECLLLEATYHANSGDMRRAFSAVRRAMACGQLLGIHRSHQVEVLQVDKSAPPFDPAYMWHRMVSADRLFSLVLDLPQGFSSAQNATNSTLAELDPEKQMDKQQCEIASWILDRNERSIDDMEFTKVIDEALQNSASLLPSNWWLVPDLCKLHSRRDIFFSTTRLVTQILHFNLINQTHLPYLHHPGRFHAYNKAACATASREILRRYIVLRDAGVVAHMYHMVEFFSLIAAMTLVLVHLERRWQDNSQELSVLAHTRASDRGMVEQAALHMSRLPTCNGSQTLGHLLQIENEAFQTNSVGSGTIIKGIGDEGSFFEFRIPYFGRLRLNSSKICFQREASIEDVSLGVKNRRDCEYVEEAPVFGDFDLGAFVSVAGGHASIPMEFEDLGLTLSL